MNDVQAVVAQYRATEDNDLKYMALKEDLPPDEICDELPSYVDELLLPILLQEPDAEIVDLVALQVYPNAVTVCLQREKCGDWLDQVVVAPLLRHMDGARSTVVMQTLKNVCRCVLEQQRGVARPEGVERRPELVDLFLQKCDDTVLSIETLCYLVQVYYAAATAATAATTWAVPANVLDSILKLCRNSLHSDVTRLLLSETFARASRRAVATVGPRMSLAEIECASSLWWQFGPIAEQLLHSQLLPSLQTVHAAGPALAVLLNFHPFYTLIRTDGQTLYGPENERLLREAVTNFLQRETATSTDSIAVAMAVASPRESLDDSDSDSDSDADPTQTAYLAQLPSDDDLEFEGESGSESDSGASAQRPNAARLARDILGQLSAKKEQQYKEVPVQQQQQLLQLQRRPDEHIVSLPALQTALETLSQMASARPPRRLHWSQLCEQLVLPRLQHDRAFVHKLKAGNLTQSIDEGATLRASAQSTLRQLLPLLDFRAACLSLAQELQHGLHDRDRGVRQLAAENVDALLAAHYHEMVGVDWQWYESLLEQCGSGETAAEGLRARLSAAHPEV